MKQVLILIWVVLLFVTGCNKERYGNVKQVVTFSSEAEAKAAGQPESAESKGDVTYYTQLGDFITEVTPSSVIGEFNMVRYLSENESGSFMTLIQVDPDNGDFLAADFSNGATISIVPTLNGTNIIENNDGEGRFFRDDVTFTVLWLQMGLKQVFDLPAQYNGINLNQFQGFANSRVGNTISTDLMPLLQPVPEFSPFGSMNFYFGKTDTTTLHFNEQLSSIPELSFTGNDNLYFIWSSKYTAWTMKPPAADETKTIVSTIGFNDTGLIHIYAGTDNIPYTSDDVAVLCPNFWERLYVNVTENK